MLILSPEFESYVTKSFADKTFDFSPQATIIPLESVVIPYFSTKSGLSVAFTLSTTIFSLALLYCLAKSKSIASSVYPTKYILTF